LANSHAPGRHSRPPGLEEVRRACLAVLTMLIAQYALGIFLNLYVTVPASDKHASLFGEITAGPFMLTVHALLGLSLIGAAIMALTRAVRAEDPMLIALATAALASIGGAFAAGEIFVKDGGQTSASLTMALLAGIAMLCYLGALALVSAPRGRRGRASDSLPAHARTAPEPLAEPDWPDQAWAEPVWSEPLPLRRPQRVSEQTVAGVTWEAPWSQGPADWP
jgi:hypothetical protein